MTAAPFSKVTPKASKLLLLLACLAVSSCDQHPSDDKVLSYFAEHRAALESMVGLFEQNPGLSSVALDDPSLANRDAAAPVVLQLREQLEQLDLSLVTRDLASGGILFVVHEVGIGVSGASKGLLHAERLLPGYTGEVVDNIDLAFATAQAWQKNHESLNVTMVRPIDGPWYLYFETY